MAELGFFAKTIFLLFLVGIYHLSSVYSNPPHEVADDAKEYSVENIEKNEMLLMQQIRDAKDWALTNGLVLPAGYLRCAGCKELVKGIVFRDMVKLAPFSLYPSPFPRQLFQKALDVHKAMLTLYFRAASELEYPKEVHKSTVKVDEQLRNDIEFIEERRREGLRQPLTVYCSRADYMVSQNGDGNEGPQYELKLVEVNAGSMGGYGTSPRVTALHRRMLTMAGVDASTSVVPTNRTGELLATALHEAWKKFGDSEAVVLFLHLMQRTYLEIESREVQQELERISEWKTKTVFLSLKEGLSRLKLDPITSNMILDDKYPVAVVVWRNFSLSKPPAEQVLEQQIRRSTVIQVPVRDFRIVQTKKMQQTFTKPGVAEKFFRGPEEAHLAASVREVLTRGWSIGEDAEEEEQIIQKAKANPEKYVLKWNECGEVKGKSIFFGDDIPKKLDSMTMEEREKFFIMERLNPVTVKNHFVLPHNEPMLNVDVNPELGIHGCVLGNIENGTVLDYFWPDSQMKTKLASVDEGGVMKGNSVFDSPYLV